LEGCYQDWCIYERERFQHMYLAMLDKLMDHCEACREYEEGLGYGSAILRCDRARERTHRRLMRLHYLARNRTAALRQYAQCVDALREELGVGPSRRTTALYEQIRADHLAGLPFEPEDARAAMEPLALPLYQTLEYLRQLYGSLLEIETHVEQDIRDLESRLGHRP
jgi:DNA-binding SARP family transcriptional activator